MTTLNAELYDALRAANVPDDKARAAAGAVTGYTTEPRLGKIEVDIAVIKSELQFHRWAFAAIVALQVAVLVKLLIQ